MDFVRARTEEQMQTRQLDIMQSCDTLFQNGGYDAVNIKAISEMTSITRSSFYTYYKSKDEVLLDLLKEELLCWKDELVAIMAVTPTMSVDEFCDALSRQLESKDKMLHLYSFLFTLLEQNCRIEKLVDFKNKIIPVMDSFNYCLQFYFPWLSDAKTEILSTQILTYVLGLYPMCHLTGKQVEALDLSNMNFHTADFNLLCKAGIKAFIEKLQ